MFMLERWDRLLFELFKTKAVALTFTSAKPAGLGREPIPQAPGCTFLELAAEGRAFYVETRDHFGHGKTADEELSELVALTVNLTYTVKKEVANLSGTKAPLRYVIYAPLGLSPTFPDLVLVHGKGRELVWFGEAVRAAGVFVGPPAWGRLAYSIPPLAAAADGVALRAEGAGNHNHSGLGDREGWLTIPGRALGTICDELASLLSAKELLAHLPKRQKPGLASDGLTSVTAFLLDLSAIDMRSFN
jgi:hypothetical protein